VILASGAAFASPCAGTLRWARVGVDDEVRARTTWGGDIGVEGVMANRALGGRRDGLAYRGGRGGCKAEAVVEL
jgi:hypothetical protein